VRANVVGWIGTALALAGVALFNSNIPNSKYALLLLAASNVFWLINGWLTNNRPLWSLQCVLLALNIYGVHRWF